MNCDFNIGGGGGDFADSAGGGAGHRYIAGAALKDSALVTSGGRVLGATAVAEDLTSAITAAYDLADRIHFENSFCRRDIGQRALKALGGN